MATVQCACTSSAYLNNWAKVGSLSALDTINSNDGNTSYYHIAGNSAGNLIWNVDNAPVDAVGVNSIIIHAIMGNSGNAGNWRFRDGDATTTYTDGVDITSKPSYTNVASPDVTWGPLSGTRTIALFNSTSYGIGNLGDDSTNDQRCTMIYVILDYIQSGMFVITWALPLLGVILPGMMPGLMRKLAPKITYTEPELESIRQDIRNAQRGYCFMGA